MLVQSDRRPCALLTGGAGYVGSHVNRALSERGWETVVVDDLSRGHRELAQWGQLEEGSLLDSEFMAGVFARHRIDVVLHFAGLTSVAESVAAPSLYSKVNVEGSAVLIGAMRDAEVATIVFSSSAAVYGHPENMPIGEDAPFSPVSPYGENKVEIEMMLGRAAAEWGLRHVSLRYFNACGAHPSATIGEWHDPETHLIPLVLDAAAGTREGVSVFGTDYDTADGTAVRDYIHVCDLADAHLLAVDFADSGRSGAFNLGTGTGYSVREVIDAARRVTSREIAVTDAPRRAGDPPRLIADGRRARDELGWLPRRSDLPTIVEDAWRWHLSSAPMRADHRRAASASD